METGQDDLQQLRNEAAMADNGAAPVAPQVDAQGKPIPEEVPIDVAGEIAALVKIAVGILSPVLPSLGEIYTEQTIGACAGAIAGVCDKHGWLQGGVMGKWGEEIAAAAILLPIGYATYNGVKGDLARLEKKASEKKGTLAAPDFSAAPPVADAPGAKTVTMGTVQPVESEGGEQ